MVPRTTDIPALRHTPGQDMKNPPSRRLSGPTADSRNPQEHGTGGVARRPAGARTGVAQRRRELLLLGDLEVALGQFLDVHVLERNNSYILHETRRPVHVPHPGILHRDLEEHLAVVGRADVQLHLVGQVEAALGLDDMAEQPDHVPVLAVELELHLGLVLLEILRTHLLPPSSRMCSSMTSTIGPLCRFSGAPSWPAASAASVANSVANSGASSAPSGRSCRRPPTFTNERRCSGLGPCRARARM